MTVLSKTASCQKFEIWAPRWKDRKVLLADYKIGLHNEITFMKTPSMPGEFYISGSQAKTYPTQAMQTKAGNTVTMRVVPIDDLEPLEREDENL